MVKNERSKVKYIMVQGTMSSAGKSLIAAGLCRIFRQDGYRVAPFKSQNMALNSYITEDGLEMGRAQVMQAEAAKTKPSVYMNPILLKPTDHYGSQVIVNGKVLGNMPAREYFAYKTKLIPDIVRALKKLEEDYEIIVIEGAGSPAEINLKENDIVNMGMAKLVDAPVLLVGDIDRGGIFAQLYGTIALLLPEERERIKGLVINKFRGDKTILDPGISMLEERCNIPVTGVIPYMDLKVDDEDSLSPRFRNRKRGWINVMVLHLPHIANFTDFSSFEQVEGMEVIYTTDPEELQEADLLILPGSKNTIADMEWMKIYGLDRAICSFAATGKPVIGICGGYQMLGKIIEDPFGVENGGSIEGLGLLPVQTILGEKKHRCQSQGTFSVKEGPLQALDGISYEGYEIHMGQTTAHRTLSEFTSNGSGYYRNNIYGTYIHGIFDQGEILRILSSSLSKTKGLHLPEGTIMDQTEWKNREYDKLAKTLRESMDLAKIYEMMGIRPYEN